MNTSINVNRLQLFTDALQSGQYDKGELLFHNPEYNTWCALGVAIDVYFDNTQNGYWEVQSPATKTAAIVLPGKTEHYIFMPEPVKEWYGFSTQDTYDIIDLNDTDHSFYDIATQLQTKYNIAPNKRKKQQRRKK